MTLRRLLAALAALVLVVACAGDDETAGPEQPSVATEPDGTPETRPSGPSTSSDAASGGGSPTSTEGGEPSPGSVATTTTAGSVTDSAPPDPGPVGSFAAFYLRPSESDSILLDVHSQSGAAPRSGTLQHLASVLGSVSEKSVSTSQATVGGGGQQWTADAIRDLADSVAPAQSRDAAVLTLLYLRGEFAERDNVIGVAVRSDVAAVFSDKVAEAAGMLGNPAAVEDAVSLHEIGHILGLVDLVLDTGREDPDHAGHSPNRESVMYYAVETTLIGTVLEGGPPREFDRADLEDLARIRNG